LQNFGGEGGARSEKESREKRLASASQQQSKNFNPPTSFVFRSREAFCDFVQGRRREMEMAGVMWAT
jgi:hypothetical protein